ncbi:MAG: chemotaxis protein CheW [Candidatus Eremiobacteraeota bacterium]|nr:chemotaxis protein CheW [Candidatus Eremiobacteraeota bacterium]
MKAFSEELLQTYYDQATEIFEELDTCLLVLEGNPNNNEMLNNIFKYIHALKASSNMMEFTCSRTLASEIEDLLLLIRYQEKDLNENMIALFFEAVECLRVTVNSELNGLQPPEYREDIISELKDESRLQKEDYSSSGALKNSGKKNKDILRTEWGKLALLMSRVEELFAGRTRLTQPGGDLSSCEMKDIGSELEKITHEIDKLIVRMQMLMVKIKRVPLQEELVRLNGLLGDLAREYKKDVKLKLECGNTEIDCELGEAMSEVLGTAVTSIVEKSVESEDVRKSPGKTPESNIELKGRYAGSDVIVDIMDDGRGLTINEISDDVQVGDRIKKIKGKFEVLSDRQRARIAYRFSVSAKSSVMKVLLVRVGNEELALPLCAVNEIVTLSKENMNRMQGRWMDNVTPTQSSNEISDNKEELSPLGIVLQDIYENAILGVDDVIGVDEVLLNNFEAETLNSQFIQGLTVLSNGRIIVVLDPGVFL